MKKRVITGALAAGIIGTLVFSTTVGDKEEILKSNEVERLYSLTPDEIDAYDEYDYEELEKEYIKESARVAYPVTAAITENDNVKVKSSDTDLLGEILSYTDGRDYNYDSSIKTPVQPEYNYVEPVKEKTVVNDGYNEADREVLSYFNEAKEQMKEYLASDDYANLKEKAKSIVVTGIDFLFYDGTIKGFTRQELTEKGKKEVIESNEATLLFLDQYFPGFSDTFGEKYTKAKEFLSEKFANALDKVKGWIGEEEYNTLGEDFKDIGSTIVDVFDEHYQGWKKK